MCCMLCNINESGEEFRLLFKCDTLRDQRNFLLRFYAFTDVNVVEHSQFKYANIGKTYL